MRTKRIPTLLFLIFACCSLPADTHEITRSGRRIQLDGFLMDWIEKDRRAWSGSTTWFWDASNTPEGVAGYFHCEKERCASWKFYADASRLRSRPGEMAVPDTAKAAGSFYKESHAAQDTAHALTVEWVIPWDSIAVDSGGIYAIRLAGMSACGDTLQPLLITGTLYSMVKHSWMPPRFGERIILIVVLLVAFVVLQLKVRKKSRRRGSLRRSA